MADSTGGGRRTEHSIPMPPADQRGAAGKGKAAGDAPEKRLNRFVRAVALIERTGNLLGTLAFTWATVILLGGYPTVLRSKDDFWFATTIVFLEAARILSRDNNRSDYQLFFRTRGAFKSLGWNGLVLVVCVSNIFIWLVQTEESHGKLNMLLLIAILVIAPFLFPGAAGLPICSPLRLGVSLWSPMVAILLLSLSLLQIYDSSYQVPMHGSRKSIAKWVVYLLLFVVVLLLTITRLRFPMIIKLVGTVPGSKLLPWRQDILNLCMFAAIGMLVSSFVDIYDKITIIMIDVCIFVIVSFGNLQFPATVLRVVLALQRLIPRDYISVGGENDPQKNNLVPSLNIFYGMVLGQGILYILACIIEAFSFFLRRSLIRYAGFRGKLGVEYVNLYYAYAFEKCMEGAMFAEKKTSLVTFAMDCLSLDSSNMQLCGVQMLHIFLQKEPFKTRVISKLTTSTRSVASLFNLLGWTGEEYTYIRTFAAKVITELAYSLRVSPIPGAVQLISSLLDTVHQPEIKDPLLDTFIQPTKVEVLIQQGSRNRENSPVLKSWKRIAMYCLIPSDIDGQKSRIIGYFKQVMKWWSIPEEELVSTDHDLLPVLGLTIIDRLSSFDLENYIEISGVTGLISKIIEFTNNKTDIINIDETLMKGLSLKVLKRLSSIKGIFGVTPRQQISGHPFLLSNLAEILHDIRSNQEHKEMAAEILRNLAVDGHISVEIRHIQGIIGNLMHAFLKGDAPSSADSDHVLQKIAGQTLALLAMESADICLFMLAERRHVIINELTTMIQDDKFKYVAASLLCNMCVHARSELNNCDLKEISYILREVLEGILDAEGAELEILVGLSSQICNIIPEDFARELEHGQIEERFIERLVHALNANKVPTSRCPGIRRAIVEQAICMMLCNPSYTDVFKKYSMMDALLTVERKPSRAENYKRFLGDAGFMEHTIPLSTLVARAKRCMSIVT